MDFIVDYKEEAKNIIYECFHEPWMNDDDWKEIEGILFQVKNFSYEKLAQDLMTGVKNGYPLEVQKDFIKIKLEQLKRNDI